MEVISKQKTKKTTTFYSKIILFYYSISSVNKLTFKTSNHKIKTKIFSAALRIMNMYLVTSALRYIIITY